MTALERQLTRALRELSAQYERERTQHAAQIAALAAAGRALCRAGDALERGLQGTRRDVARALELMRQLPPRGPERDHGPSR